MSWFSSQFNRWSEAAREGAASMFGPDANGSNASAEIRRVEIIWGKQRMHIVLPRAVQPPTLRNLKDEIHAVTAVPVHQQKLIFQGLLLKDDRANLGALGIREGSKLTLIGTAGGVDADDAQRAGASSASASTSAIPSGRLAAQEAERARRAREADDSEEGLLQRIQQTIKGVDEDLLPEVEQLERAIAQHQDGSSASASAPSVTSTAALPRPGATPAPASQLAAAAQGQAQSHMPSSQPTDGPSSSAPSQPLDSKELNALHRKLSEMLLRALLALDNIQVPTDTLRTARRGAVRTVQSYLDRVDQAWETYKARPASNATAAQL